MIRGGFDGAERGYSRPMYSRPLQVPSPGVLAESPDPLRSGRPCDPRSRLLSLAATCALLACALAGPGLGADAELPAAPAPRAAPPLTTHPRLWLRADDLPRLRSWATASNPAWSQGLAPLAVRVKADIDAGLVPGDDAENGANAWVEYPPEAYAELCAFLSLIGPEADRADWASRARTLLMYVIDRALPGAAEGQPYRDPEFSTSDRSRWHGEGFGLTVDWIYPSLTASDKEKIRTVFLRWAAENADAAITGHDHPEPKGVVNDPVLVDSPDKTRWAVNNYFTAHMRNLGLMAMALDPADDPDGALRGQIASVTGAWLYTFDRGLRVDAQGGLVPEGFEYGPETLGFAAQLLLALETAGVDDPAVHGPQVQFDGNPFWGDLVTAFLHSISPVAVPSPSQEGRPGFQPAWYGDGQVYRAADFIEVFGPLGVHDRSAGNASRREALRWIQTNVPLGGADGLLERIADPGDALQQSILYFLLLEPGLPAAADPRPALGRTHFAPGLGRILSRTDWGPSASWFSYKLSYNSVDHQYGDGNQVELWRKGEWLTRERTGWDLEYGGPRNHNTLAIENDRPDHTDECAYRDINWKDGAQWAYVATGDPTLVSWGEGAGHLSVTGDATNLYNSEYELSTDVLHASRSVVWLPPDHLVVYDRAATRTAGRFKRFWLAFTGPAAVSGPRTTVETPGGQRLHVTTLLPRDAALAVEPASILHCGGAPAGADSAAVDDPIRTFLRVEAPGGPAATRFLHVLEGADAGAPASAVRLVESTAGTPYVGAAVGATAVLFPVDLGTAFTGVSYPAPAGVTTHKVTGLVPGGAYTVAATATTVTVSSGGPLVADVGGVVTFVSGAAGPWIASVEPARGPLAGGTVVTVRGGGFSAAATVAFGGVPALSVTVVSASELRATTPPGAAAGAVTVEVRNPDDTAVSLAAGFVYEAAPSAATVLFVPIVLSLEGLGGSSYSSELTFTNRGSAEAALTLTYAAAFGGGGGTAVATVPAGRQLVVPDAIAWLASLGVPLPSSGSRGGTLRVAAEGLVGAADLGVAVRTTTAVPEGRAGLAYAGIGTGDLLGSSPALVFGLRQNATDRSNLAVAHAGPAGSGDVTLRATVVSGDPAMPSSHPLADVTLAPGGFFQWTEVLASEGLSLGNGFARIERVAGTAPWTAYGVVNDNGTNDGSFLPPVPDDGTRDAVRLVVPAVVATGAFSTELVAANTGSLSRTVAFEWVAGGIATPDHTARFERTLAPGEQWIEPDVAAFLRAQGAQGVGGGTLAGALFATPDGAGVLLGARTSSAGARGRFGVFYAAVPDQALAHTSATLDLLVQDAANRTNLGIVDAGAAGAPQGTYAVDLHDGETGAVVATVGGLVVPASGWLQLGTVLSTHAPGTRFAHARVRRTSGPGPFLAYTVVNDGASPGQRSGDGAYVAMGARE